MKILRVDTNKKHILIKSDYLEIESLGYDIKKHEDMTGFFWKTLATLLEEITKEVFPSFDDFGIRPSIDEEKGIVYFEVMPRDVWLNNFVFSEMRKDGRKWYAYGNHIWMLENG